MTRTVNLQLYSSLEDTDSSSTAEVPLLDEGTSKKTEGTTFSAKQLKSSARNRP